MKKFAVIDTETTYYDHLMSVGVVIAIEESFEIVDRLYYVIEPECYEPAMFSHVLTKLRSDKTIAMKGSRENVMTDLAHRLNMANVSDIFAYNAGFDYAHIPELTAYDWFDIMKLACYKQHNSKLPECANYCKTGRLKDGYGVERVLRLMTENEFYSEVHNAICDAEDELEIMKLMNLPLESYSIAKIK